MPLAAENVYQVETEKSVTSDTFTVVNHRNMVAKQVGAKMGKSTRPV